MKHFTKKLALLTLLAGLCGSAWADNVYNIVYGVPTYDSDETTIIGVTPQTDFTSADGNTASDVTSSDANGSNCTNAMPIGGSVLYSSASFPKLFIKFTHFWKCEISLLVKKLVSSPLLTFPCKIWWTYRRLRWQSPDPDS